MQVSSLQNTKELALRMPRLINLVTSPENTGPLQHLMHVSLNASWNCLCISTLIVFFWYISTSFKLFTFPPPSCDDRTMKNSDKCFPLCFFLHLIKLVQIKIIPTKHWSRSYFGFRGLICSYLHWPLVFRVSHIVWQPWR